MGIPPVGLEYSFCQNYLTWTGKAIVHLSRGFVTGGLRLVSQFGQPGCGAF